MEKQGQAVSPFIALLEFVSIACNPGDLKDLSARGKNSCNVPASRNRRVVIAFINKLDSLHGTVSVVSKVFARRDDNHVVLDTTEPRNFTDYLYSSEFRFNRTERLRRSDGLVKSVVTYRDWMSLHLSMVDFNCRG
ncbi:hypothetical protein PUN28_007951 [Cardiocondyla obscurior]|uniref:Uncharacterized protein n=1 Tax=Cardiocondyla obscurior TaxID=286306 RepID=A0AAW2G057_9HYME